MHLSNKPILFMKKITAMCLSCLSVSAFSCKDEDFPREQIHTQRVPLPPYLYRSDSIVFEVYQCGTARGVDWDNVYDDLVNQLTIATTMYAVTDKAIVE